MPYLSIVEVVVPLLLVVAITLPLIKVFRGKTSKKSAKRRLITHIAGFFTIVLMVFTMQLIVNPRIYGFESDGSIVGTIAQGFGFLAAALATGLSALGAGIAVAAAAPAAIGAFSENEKNFGKSLIFVALGEGVAIYGLLISILIIGNLA